MDLLRKTPKFPIGTDFLFHGNVSKLLIALILAWFALAPAARAFDVAFPGPTTISSLEDATCALTVPWPGAEADYLVAGDEGGFLSLVRLLSGDSNFNLLYRQYLSGVLVDIIHWENPPGGGSGLVVATANPDRLIFISLQNVNPFFEIIDQVDLPEDPGTMAFCGPMIPGGQELAVSLPGVDRVALMKSGPAGWSLIRILEAGDNPHDLVALDLEEDGVREIITADRGVLSGSLGIFRRDGAGVYSRTGQTQVSGWPSVLETWDVAGNGRQELLVGMSDAAEVHLYDAAGGQLTPRDSLSLTLPAEDIHLAPLPGGQLGLMTSVEARGLLEFFALDQGTWSVRESYYPGCRPRGISSGDFNGDGREDLVCLGSGNLNTTVLFGHSGGGFRGFPALTLNQAPGAAELADFDLDGVPDFVVAGSEQQVLSYYPGRSAGGLNTTSEDLELGFLGGGLVAIEAGGSPGPELALLDFFTGSLRVYDFTVESGFQFWQSRTVLPFPQKMETADLDGDGNADLFMARPTSSDLLVLFGDGAGQFNSDFSLTIPTGAENTVAVDLNADQLLDLVVVDGVSRVFSYLNQGDRTFAQESWVLAGTGARFLAVGDLDGDLDQDVVVANRTEESLTLLENDGSGTLLRRIGSHTLGGKPLGVICSDMNKSGQTDILVNLGEEGNLGFIYGLGDWNFGTVLRFAGGTSITSFELGDFNLDGYPDVLNLDPTLRLGLTMLNVDPSLVALDPSSLRYNCTGARLETEILPDRAGPWQLQLLWNQQWFELASSSGSVRGELEYDGRRWYHSLGWEELRRELGEAGSGDPVLRLTSGQGAQLDHLDLVVGGGCVPSHFPETLPALQWETEPWPNPFNPRLQTRFSLDRPGIVSAAIFDLRGRRVESLLEGPLAGGIHTLSWDGTAGGQPQAGGVYFLKIEAQGNVLSRKILLLK